MKKFSVYSLFILLALTFYACSEKEERKDWQATFFKINHEVNSNSQAYMRLKESTETIGHRLTGSENGQKAEEYTYQLFKDFGFDQVEYMPFEVEAWSRESIETKVAVGTAALESTPSVSLAHSPITFDEELELIDAGNGLVEDYERLGDAVKEKLVLVYLGILPDSGEGKKNLHRSEKTALAVQNGAAGIVFYNSVPNGVLLTGTASVTGKLIDIPAICIAHEKGMELSKQMRNGNKVNMHISMKNKSEVIKARNVIATLEGSELPDERVIVGGHLDSWDLATGAIDNGIGSFAIIDMARTFQALRLQPKRTVQFVMFMGEEQGLLGSSYMVNYEKENGTLDQVKYMMNIDMTGNPIGFNGGGRDVEEFFLEVGEKIKAVDSLHFKNTFRNGAGLHSDHQPFLLEGIPYVSLVGNLDRKVYGCYHADCDDFSLVNEDHIKNTVRFSSMMLYALADADQLPAQRMSDDATKQFLEEAGLKEKLELGGDWRW